MSDKKRTLDDSIAGDFVDGKPDAGIANDQLEGSPFLEPMQFDLFDEENKLSPQNTEMLMGSLDTIMRRSGIIGAIISEYGYAPPWAESKVYVAREYVDGVADYMETEVSRKDRSGIEPHIPVFSDTIEYRHILNGFVGLDLAPKETEWSFTEKDRTEIVGEIETEDGMPDLERWSSCFLFVNKGGEDELTAYKLPIAKMIDGVLHIVFHGVAKAGAVLRGEDKDQDTFYDISQATERDRVLMYKTIAKFYREFGEVAPEYRAINTRDEEEDDLASYKNRKEAFEELSETVQKSLEKKAKEHNEEYGEDSRKRTDKFILAVCFHRGVGAYHNNPSSVRPTVNSPEQWAQARVNGLLYALAKLKFKGKPYDTDLLPVDHPLSTRERAKEDRGNEPLNWDELETFIEKSSIGFDELKAIVRAVGDTDPTNFPTDGEDEKVSLRNSNYPLFDVEYAKNLKENYPEIWDLGGNVLGNKQFNRLVPIAENNGQIETRTDEEAVRLREAWIARHEQDFRIAGTVAQIKWLAIGERGEKYMKDLIKEEIEKRELSELETVDAPTSHTVEVRTDDQGLPDVEDIVAKLDETVAVDLEERSEVSVSLKDELVEQVDEQRATTPMSKPQRLEKEQFVVRQMSIENENVRYQLDGRGELKIGVGELKIRAVYDDGTTAETAEERVRMGRPPKYYSIEGIASSTSVDHYGTEMTYNALLNMQAQFMAGVPILPRHQSLYGDGMAEWDEVIGRSMEAEIRMMNPSDMENAYDYGEKQYVLNVKSRLYGDDKKAQELVRRLDRGEPIGQSIGGWFNKMDVVENKEGEIQRIMVEDLTLDHLAITRAPANPDSYGLASIRSSLNDKLSTFKRDMGLDPKEEAKTLIAKLPEAFKRHIVKVVEYEDKIDICFGKSGDFMGMFKEGEELPEEMMGDEMDENMGHGEDEKEGMNKVELRGEEQSQHIDEKNVVNSETVEDNENVTEEAQQRAIVDNSENSNLSEPTQCDNNKQNIEQNELDNDVIVYDDNITSRSQTKDLNSLSENTEEYIMRDEDFAKIAEMMRSAVEPIAERITKLEETEKVETRSVPTPEPAPVVEDKNVAELKRELEETRAILDQVMAQPVRTGRHLTTQIRGVGSKNAYSELIARSRQEGFSALSTIIEQNIEAIAGESSDDVTKRSQHDLVDLLAKGLRSAQLDGLLGSKAVTNWN